MKFIQAFASLVLIGACLHASLADAQQSRRPRGQQPEPPKPSTVPEKIFPTGTLWVLREMNGKPVPAGIEATLTLDTANRGSGASGCNTWSAPMVALPGQRLAMGAVAMTRRTCPAPNVAFERAYLTILHSGPSWDIPVSDLIVKTQSGSLTFKRGL